MIEAKNLQKNFGEVQAVRDVSFIAERGKVLGFLGPNGAGKTTTLRMLTTVLKPTSGSVKVAGFDVVKESAEVRKRIGYLPETPPLYDDLTVKEYLTFAARIRGLPSSEVKLAVDEVIERCFLKEMQQRLCKQLSKGYRQRVGIAQALVHRPEVVVLDEPTSGLDPQQIVQIRELIASLKEQHTVIFSSHILQEVVATCSHVVIINEGRVVLSDSLEHILEQSSLEQVYLQALSAA